MLVLICLTYAGPSTPSAEGQDERWVVLLPCSVPFVVSSDSVESLDEIGAQGERGLAVNCGDAKLASDLNISESNGGKKSRLAASGGVP